jgi:ribokinase
MARIFVSGLINIETTLRIDQFPIEYFPVTYPFYGISTSVSGVGFNIAKALSILSNSVDLVSITGKDIYEPIVREELIKNGISDHYLRSDMDNTPQSVILYDNEGNRQIHVDLKNIQDKFYPSQDMNDAISESELCVLCNINFSRNFLEIAKNKDKLIATDVHAIRDTNDEYNRDFLKAADILFLSNENLSLPPELFIHSIWKNFQTPICVIGMGNMGALLAVKSDKSLVRYPAIQIRQVVNTIGAGDALFSAFIDSYLRNKDPYLAIQQAIVFASYKIGFSGAATGFLNRVELEDLSEKFLPLSPYKF